MTQIIDQSLQKIAKGAGIFLFGTVVGLLFGLLGRTLLARSFTQAEYGIFSLGIVILNLIVVLSLLGFPQGITRQIAYWRGKGDSPRVKGIALSSIQIVVISSILLSIILFFAADILSIGFFHESRLSTPLKVLAIALPFFALMQVLGSIFRAFEKVKENIFFNSILRSVLFPLLLVPIIYFGLSFVNTIYAFTASFILAGTAFIVYTVKKSPLPAVKYTSINPIGKELLFFSLPILGSNILGYGRMQADNLMLSYFLPMNSVGLYNGALPLARLLPTLGLASTFLYLPITSQLYSENKDFELSRIYGVLTKWIFFAALPLFLIFFLFPDTVLSFLFGPRYIGASQALQILVLGIFLSSLLGNNGITLMTMGKTKFILFAGLIATVFTLAANIVLIPIYGIIGAAIATASSGCLISTIMSAKLYQVSKIHPFTKNYLKSIGCSIVLLALIYLLGSFVKVHFWMLPLIVGAFLISYAGSLIITKSFDREDISLLLAIERRGVNLRPIKSILGSYLNG